MIRSAEDARKLSNKRNELPQISQALTDVVQEKIGEAAKKGLKQVTVDLPYKLVELDALDQLKMELKKAGYSFLTGHTKGIFVQNLIKEPKVSITIMW